MLTPKYLWDSNVDVSVKYTTTMPALRTRSFAHGLIVVICGSWKFISKDARWNMLIGSVYIMLFSFMYPLQHIWRCLIIRQSRIRFWRKKPPRTCIDWRIPDCLKHTHVIPPKFNSLPLKIYEWKTRCLVSKTHVFLEKRCCYNDTQVCACVCVSTYHLSLMLLIMEVWNIPPWNSWTHCSLLVSRRVRYLHEIHHIKRPHKWVRCWFQTFSIFHPKGLGTDSHVHMNGSTRLKHQDAGPPFIQSVSKAWKMPEKSPKGVWW